MELSKLGYQPVFDVFIEENQLADFEIGRIITEHKERYIIATRNGEIEAEVTGNLRFTAVGREDFPAVGDWVAFVNYGDETGIIHKILPRYSVLSRRTAGKQNEIQLIAANIDCAFLMQAVDRDFSLNRLERYLTICFSGNVDPVIILTKTDLLSDEKLSEMKNIISQRIKNIPLIAISNETMTGYDELTAMIESGKTYCMLGSSGVGKSSLMNNLSGKEQMKTGVISESTNRGKHVTTHRELLVLDSGVILIDNPGMREIGLADVTSGIEDTFDRIIDLSQKCRYQDCTHTTERDCAVLMALENGDLDRAVYENYLKLEREKNHYETTVADRKKKDKSLGKILKNYQKTARKNSWQ